MSAIKVVLDTNVLVSALLSQGPPAQIIKMVGAKLLRPCYSSTILSEYWTVLSRPKFSFGAEKINALINGLTQRGFLILPKKSNIAFTDESDRKFYDAAVSSQAILLTGNLRHFPKKSWLMAPAEFIKFTANQK
ncbi:MAG: putative toxin-antitoxin system toxin component, PIN family [Candidatus Margulisbacteria bacterium]|jgi:putative PIN family toxin of toxin-antitoxin system|nr:putative toxin-antitoxin system toxin component, PIN family [Candidatus Margulisiibacteriota bacterium]